MADVIAFEPFSTLLHPTFWHRLTQLKLNILQLNESAVDIIATYALDGNRGQPPQFIIDYTAFDSSLDSIRFTYQSRGKLINTNTIEGFQTLCSKSSLKKACEHVYDAISSGTALHDPSVLTSTLFLCHGDLKRFHFHYWIAYPVLSPRQPFTFCQKPLLLPTAWGSDKWSHFERSLLAADFPFAHLPAFAYKQHAGQFIQLPEVKSSQTPLDEVCFCFADPSTSENFGWPLRNLLVLIQQQLLLNPEEVKIIALRRGKDAENLLSFKTSLFFSVKMQKMDNFTLEGCSLIGWERDRKSGKLQPSFVDMSRSMDPVKLANEAVNLNLKLMKWRVAPELDLEKIAKTSCLLLGCGTLGCNVSRCLLSWGVHKIALVDNGKVSYSNPVRQSLYNFQHCIDSKLMKADAAADALRQIFPGVEVTSHADLTIPMPGHPISSATLSDSRRNWEELDKLVREADVVFLLTDSRESRWLPTVMAAAYGKLAITSALGFDSFLVMRHGGKGADTNLHKLGCYFCTDVVGPANSLRERTLDQQCTVSRGGISMLSSGLAVELMISVLNHPLGAAAPANSTDACLGVVPHQIRGFLSKYEQLCVDSPSFKSCSACSHAVIEAYLREGFDFVIKVCSNPSYLEEISGLAELQRESAKLSLDDFCVSEDDDF